MILDELARGVFGFLCHQNPARSFAPSGTALAICARCTGVYVCFALALPMLTLARRLGGKAMICLHGIMVMQVAVFGFHLVSHGPMVRTLSGQMFAVGLMYFLFRAASPGQSSQVHPTGPCLVAYISATAAALVALQLLVRLDQPWTATLVNVLALIGLGIFGVLGCGVVERWLRAKKLVVSQSLGQG